ncbi:MAG: VCBS repeat-containing protein, partial [Proteobacteria bacterium]|nr:VCBS repeat-containing protein [Pseudomonadota bacterium]
GIEPKLSLVYTSGGQDGPLGPGWALAGLSAISRCNKTYADNGASPAPVTLTTSDDYCLDGNRLRVTSGTYGAVNSVYQTQLANFSRVTASATTAGNGPSSFVVEGKDGLRYEYGNTVDSKAYTNGGSTPYAWMLNKVRDRQGNNLTITYSTTSGSIQPANIQYTQTPATGTTYPYKVVFTYQNRVTNLSRYVAGGNILQTQILAKIDVQSSGVSVRKYNLSYQTALTTIRDRLASIQECGGSAGTDCLRPTSVTYQNGAAGVAAPATATGSGATSGTMNTADINGDGKLDLVFAVSTGASSQWWVQLANATGYDLPVNTGAVTTSTQEILLDDFAGDGKTELLAPSAGVWTAYRLSGSSFTATSTGLAYDTTATSFATADVQGDGKPDIVLVKPPLIQFYIASNTSSGGSISFSAPVSAGSLAGIVNSPKIWGNNSIAGSSIKHMDFDGDGREDLLFYHTACAIGAGGCVTSYEALLSRGTSFTFGGFVIVGSPTYNGVALPVRWNDDQCTDFVVDATVLISPCDGTAQTPLAIGSQVSLALDWDGDGRSDLFAGSTGTWQIYKSLSTSIGTAASTGISVGTGTWAVTDRNGDGL